MNNLQREAISQTESLEHAIKCIIKDIDILEVHYEEWGQRCGMNDDETYGYWRASNDMRDVLRKVLEKHCAE